MSNEHSAAPSGLYHFIWRWHFYAGLFVAPFVLILALTGAVYLFNNEIEGVLYRNMVRVDPPAISVAASVQEAAALNAHPGSTISRYKPPIAPDRAAEWTLRKPDGRSVILFVDPATATITGEIDSNEKLGTILVRLHGELLAGRAGDLLVEFAGCWAFVLLVTGVFLWWPRKTRRVGVAAPRLKARGRSLWRDLHAVPAAWNAPIVAFLILSGLPWSGFWGDNLAKLGALDPLAAAMAPTPNFVAPPSAPFNAHQQPDEKTSRLEDNPDAADLPWAVRQAALPQGDQRNERIGIDDLVAISRANGIDRAGLRIIYPSGPSGVFTLSYVPDRAEEQRTIHVNPADGAILQNVGWTQYSPLGKAVEFGVMAHMGRQFGEANRWLMLASCVILVLTIVFGFAMWWSRRPPGRLAAPPVPETFRPNALVILVAVLLGVAFPLVGASMLAILVFEGLVRRKLP